MTHTIPPALPRTWQRREPASGFGEVLATFRNQRGLSQVELAERAGLNHATVSRLESGERLPTLRPVASVAAALNLNDEDRAVLALVAIDTWR